MMGSKRRLNSAGTVRQLPSGRWQARVTTNGAQLAIGTFANKREAERVLADAMVGQARGSWLDPRPGKVLFREYSTLWLEHRSTLRPRTKELYESQLRLYLLPTFGAVPIADIASPSVRAWHARMVAAGKPGPVTIAKAYRLLRTIFGTAVEDGVIAKNPCIIKNAGVERSPERPVATIDEVYMIAAAIDPRFRMLVLLGTFTALRLGELSALRRNRVDLAAGTIRVVEAVSELGNGTRVTGEPKSWAGRRTVAIPAGLLDELREHLDAYSEPGPDGLVFVGPLGGPVRRSNWSTTWRDVVVPIGLGHLRFHDLRHTAYRQHSRRRDRRINEGADGPNGALVGACGVVVSARHGGAGTADRRETQRHDHRRSGWCRDWLNAPSPNRLSAVR